MYVHRSRGQYLFQIKDNHGPNPELAKRVYDPPKIKDGLCMFVILSLISICYLPSLIFYLLTESAPPPFPESHPAMIIITAHNPNNTLFIISFSL
jgi:hypothetical protein